MDQPLLSLRTTLVLLLALLAGAAAGGLTALAGEGTPHSLLAALATVGLAVPFFNHLIAAEDNQGRQHGDTGSQAGEGEGNG
ncbi:hypothetical protein [Streptomyces sp. ML-6]|uniref:hypothetical protein n=1 Tax=Streptomyces sp. ML-6 TaxID=2982693 RepID=UPI0024C00148|nr:hypothetical protein [Streptomyces sp. ML-6]MDK0517531.1 hypothetical protein [Streptomyces sp. ML-6]